MNFGETSHKLLKYSRARAKLNEFSVSEDERKENGLIYTSSTELLYSSVRVLSEYAESYLADEDRTDLYDDLTFVSRFYENHIEAESGTDDYFFFLVGAVANILSDNFGNAVSLLSKINYVPEGMNPVAQIVYDYMINSLNVKNRASQVSDEVLSEALLTPIINELKNNDNSDMAEQLKEFADATLKGKDYESAFFAHILCALQKKYLDNSTTRKIPQFTDSTFSDWDAYFDQENSIKILWQAQKLLLEKDVLKGKNATIQLPTGVGKTKSIELIIASAFLLRKVSLAIVVAPLRALCNEIEKDLKRSIGKIVSITDITDVLAEDVQIDYAEKQVIVITPEKLSFLIKHDLEIISKCGLIIFDEAHMFDDQSRGAIYEILVLRVKDLLDEVAQKVFISAVMPNAEELNDWLTEGKGVIVNDKDIKRTEKSIGFFSQKNNKITFFEQSELVRTREEMVFIPRICPKDAFVLDYYKRRAKTKGGMTRNKGDPKTIFPDQEKSAEVALFLACNLCKTGSVAVYVNKPRQIFSIAKKVKGLHNKNYPQMINILGKTDAEEKNKIYSLAEEHFGRESEIVQVMQQGVFPHYGDLENGLRISIEHAIRNRKIAFVLCTSTLAEGVNLPIRYLIVTTFKDPYGQIISTRKFQNLLGRTARSGIYTEGSLICSDPDVFDHNDEYGKLQYWGKVVKLFNPSESEDCNSIILKIFEDLKFTYEGATLDGSWLLDTFLENYREGNSSVDSSKILEAMSDFAKEKKYVPRREIEEIVPNRISLIKTVVETLESIIMDEISQLMETDMEIKSHMDNLASKTLAYRLADSNKKTLITNLFREIGDKVAKISTEKRAIFSKTTSSVDMLNLVDEYLRQNPNLYLEYKFDEEAWIGATIELSNYYSIKKFNTLKQQQKEQILRGWIEGKTYKEIHSMVLEIDIQEIAEICHKLGYSINLLFACIIELIQQYKPKEKVGIERLLSKDEWELYVEELTLFQQRIKYGLVNRAEIAAYEVGFADRVISRKIGALVFNKNNEQSVEGYRALMCNYKDDIEKVIEKYPSYFSTITY